MSIAKEAAPYVPTPVKPSRKVDLMVISEMSTAKIIGFVAHKHRVGLLMLTTFALFAYIAYDKVLHLFF